MGAGRKAELLRAQSGADIGAVTRVGPGGADAPAQCSLTPRSWPCLPSWSNSTTLARSIPGRRLRVLQVNALSWSTRIRPTCWSCWWWCTRSRICCPTSLKSPSSCTLTTPACSSYNCTPRQSSSSALAQPSEPSPGRIPLPRPTARRTCPGPHQPGRIPHPNS